MNDNNSMTFYNVYYKIFLYEKAYTYICAIFKWVKILLVL